MLCAISFQCLSCWQHWAHYSGRVINACLLQVSLRTWTAPSPGGLWMFLAFGNLLCRESLVGCCSGSQSMDIFSRKNYCRHITGSHSARLCRRLTGVSSSQSFGEFVLYRKSCCMSLRRSKCWETCFWSRFCRHSRRHGNACLVAVLLSFC